MARNGIEISVKDKQIMDNYLHVSNDDVLILRCKKSLFPDELMRLEEQLSEAIGKRVVLLDSVFEVIGTAENSCNRDVEV